MKKILFTLAGVLTLALSSCFENTGSNYTTTFSRVVTVDTTSSVVKLVADYTDEVFKDFVNLRTPEQLKQFGIFEAKRAETLIQLDVDASYHHTLTMLQAREIDIYPVTNKMPADSLMPLTGWQQYPLGGTPYKPTAWVSNGYLNILPVIPSKKPGTYYLMPDSAVSDTLHFSLKASYTPNDYNEYYENIQSYDLRTLCDTTDAAPDFRERMTELLDAMKQHRNDSVVIVVTSMFDIHYYEKDTLMEQSAVTNYFKSGFIQ